ncbi:2-amino-4-hydroxy-6-hydroxymethyldihydropteridine diphosphokinase [Gracilibacillus sp. S3-1-1]|uniref:2-amino-4-hydroxy-6-hydroxymethyldihydropteridine diphosphokinase n=1 Tax=Gracilibacillus pellucidus TaxID=3095368 RepID=A0ACC6M9U5_9BACI|nr:2-amino-4-hydroxy-6-hydroxymethyldihydropteridine diphosphokinase [Gracilibacillus sp. S3-1-1]MDX8047705.1 2-amino-4-hydroxy-6-hydroxymethyldihydropteridine diphosphokinase [Gracilibacillus sp. S3-1-1]
MNKAYIALGSNIEPRLTYLNKAIDHLANHDKIEVAAESSIYETDPVGYVEQEQFLNMVIEATTELDPIALLDVCQSVESKLGREREIKWGPRTIDLDILLYHQEVFESERLILPHPRLHERAFVLIPLAEINPLLYIEQLRQNITQLLTTIPVQDKEGVVKWQQLDGVNESKRLES